MNTNIFRDNIQLETFKTKVTTNTRALVTDKLYGSVAKRASQTTLNISCLSRKEFNSLEEQILSWSTSQKS